ncbi:hypothetical protein Tamer19_56470 [Cupriavidus sp. TA19]|uniref:toxin-antitoxin system YwqK family antitoxin n=1 Tax=unclassified Cupriavidus TaxID=2640874 RepID=UPI000E2FCBC4|nr:MULTISPECIES: hypothetical protein [unclassified Cupriavidus]BDB30032.1 toxin-antitoxin system YwqK family antitoxin [Cupriavidus sp. P-10]GLC96238.1 hypothetical protein Tamer19_56470 [Cupriavidus sp. TA19]
MHATAPLDTAANANAAPTDTQVVEERDAAGRLLSRCGLAGGLPQGRMERFAPHGTLLLEADYVAGKLSGWLRSYDAAGEPVLASHYAGGLRHGPSQSYQQGRLACREHYVNGVLEGERNCYGPAGELVAQAVFRQGLLEGEAIWLHEGVVVRRSRFRAGKLDGETRSYAADGTLTLSEPFRADLLHGTARRFDEAGRVSWQRDYMEGKPRGEWRAAAATDNGAAAPSFSRRLERWVRG